MRKPLKLSSYTTIPASKGLSTDYCNRKKRPKIYRRTSFLRYGTTAHPSIPSITLNLIFSCFQKCGVSAHRTHTTVQELSAERNQEKYIPPLESNETDDNIHLKELELLVTMVVEKMPPQRQKIYKMSRESGMNNEEIARELSINKRTVENHLSQALTDIRKALFITFILFF